MTQIRQRCGFLLATLLIIITSAVCTMPADVAGQPQSPKTTVTKPAAAPSPVTAQPPQPQTGTTLTPPLVISPGDGPLVRLECRPKPGEVSYLSIEHEFKESGGVQPLLSYTTTTKERRFIIQRVLQASSQPASGGAMIEWECDRYEAREKGMKDETVFDSLRHLYPPPPLYLLGSVPGSKCRFQLDTSGNASAIQLTPGTISGGQPGRGTASKTTEKFQISQENLKHLLDDLGPFYLPREPVRVGAVWSFKVIDIQRNVGTTTTTVKCSLRGIRKSEGEEVATIDISSDTVLQAEKVIQPAPTTRPGQVTTAPAKPREFKLDRAVCTGSVDFNITRGEPVQLNLRRELGVSAEIDGQSMGPMKLTTGNAENLKVTVSRTPTPKPVIVGGKVAPPMPKEDPRAHAPLHTPTTRPTVAASQPTSRPGMKLTTTHPSPGTSSDGLKNLSKSPPTQPPPKRLPTSNGADWTPATRPAARPQPVTAVRSRSSELTSRPAR